MATSYTDGLIQADSFAASIGGQSFIVNNIQLNAPPIQAERNNEKGALDAKVSKLDLTRMAGTAELQIAASANNIRLQYETFTVPASASGTPDSFIAVIDEETSNTVVNESRTRAISFRPLGFPYAALTYNGQMIVYNGEMITYNYEP